MAKKIDKISRSKFNICWISILVIFIGTIVYPISYERAERKALADANLQNIIDTLTPLPTVSDIPVVETTAPEAFTLEPVVVKPIMNPEVKISSELVFKRDLKMGDRGLDVKLLQEYLNQKGFIVAESGVGSPGRETELFGENTRKALKRFQEANSAIILEPYGLTEGTGYFGSATRALFNS